MANPEGNQPISEEQKQDMLRQLEPYLKSGLSTRKALLEAKIPSSTFYDLMREDEQFAEQVERFRHYPSILLNNAIQRHLQDIMTKQQTPLLDEQGKQRVDARGNPMFEPLTKDEIGFMQWYALNANITKQEFGERKDITMFDPEAEVQRVKGIIAKQTTKKLPPLT